MLEERRQGYIQMDESIKDIRKDIGELKDRTRTLEVQSEERFKTLFDQNDRIEIKVDRMIDSHEQTSRSLDGLKTKVAMITGGVSIGIGTLAHWVSAKFK